MFILLKNLLLREFPHQLIENTKEHKNNEAKKLKEAGNKCEECGSIDQELFVYFEDVNPRSYQKKWEGAIKWTLLDFLLKDRFRLEYADLFMVRETKKQYKERLNLSFFYISGILFYKSICRII